MSLQHSSESAIGGIIKSMGLVFGDIGTSPIYTLSVIFALTAPTKENVFGILSLVVWTLIILVTIEYSWLAMALSYKGEGGTIVLKEILVRLIKPGRQLVFVTFLTFLGVSLLLGDGVITPAISILSAVEGLVLIPGFSGIHQTFLICIAAVIAIGLFIFQFKGTDRVASAFGPIMVVWFIVLTLSGLASIATTPEIVGAISPHHALKFFAENGFSAFFVLSEVILCATGGEALYADMGHLGRAPILHAWSIVFFALVINYLGQGAYALQHGAETNILFSMVRSQAPLLYVPFLLLTICATIIASQALISGVFSVVYQGITTRIMPLMRVDFTSMRLKSQIYISAVNWSKMCAVIFIMFLFKKSENLAAAYGLAVTGTMAITGMMMVMIYYARGSFKLIPIAIFVTIIDFVFLISNLNKLAHGGYWSLILASIPLSTILIWTYGQKRLYRALAPLDIETFLTSYQQIYAAGRIRGCALFFTKGLEVVPPYAVHTILKSNIIYERNVFISVMRTDDPFGQEVALKEGIAPGLDFLDIHAGYMAVVDIEQILRENGIREKIIFYGIEEIHTNNPFWRFFSLIKKISPNFVQFNKLPAGRMHGVATRVEM